MAKVKSRKDAHYDEYCEVLVKDTPNKDFVKEFE